MKLIKDLHNHRVIYYWVDDNNLRCSPVLPSLTAAKEWQTVHLHQEYQGWNRRRSHVDRRRYQHKRNSVALDQEQMALITSGRRSSDRTSKVAIDRAQPKLTALFAQYAPQNSEDTDDMYPERNNRAY